MNGRKGALLDLGVLVFSLAGFAQTGGLEGHVKGEDGTPVKGGTIKIERRDLKGIYKVTTDKNGHYIYVGLPLGVYRVSIEVDGQERDYVDNVRNRIGDLKEVSFDLHAAAEKTPEPVVGRAAPPVVLALPFTYVNSQTPADELQLNADRSFLLQEAGQSYHGTFVVNGNTVELSINETKDKTTATLQGSNLTDSSGQTWVLRGQSARSAPGAAAVQKDEVALAPADAAAGEALYATKCKGCHGTDGGGNPAIAGMIRVTLRPLGSGAVQAKSDADLKKDTTAGTGKMKPVKLTDAEASDVVAYLRTLK